MSAGFQHLLEPTHHHPIIFSDFSPMPMHQELTHFRAYHCPPDGHFKICHHGHCWYNRRIFGDKFLPRRCFQICRQGEEVSSHCGPERQCWPRPSTGSRCTRDLRWVEIYQHEACQDSAHGPRYDFALIWNWKRLGPVFWLAA